MEEKDTYTKEEVEQLKADLEKKHNSEMASVRTKHDKEIADLKLSEEDRVKKQKEEQEQAVKAELDELRAYKKNSIIVDKLAKENLPLFLKNDSRLIGAETDKALDDAIKTIKSEYASSMPKGAQHSTVVNSNNANNDNGGKISGSDFDDIIRKSAGR